MLTANKIIIKILSLSLNTMLTVDEHCSDVWCDEFPVPHATNWSQKQINKQQQIEKILFAISMGNDSQS